jgi:hypothetical protein
MSSQETLQEPTASDAYRELYCRTANNSSAWLATSDLTVTKEFISILTIRVPQKPRGEPFQARPISLCLVGHHPSAPSQ